MRITFTDKVPSVTGVRNIIRPLVTYVMKYMIERKLSRHDRVRMVNTGVKPAIYPILSAIQTYAILRVRLSHIYPNVIELN